jgi:lysophospholipase L1-like esterase
MRKLLTIVLVLGALLLLPREHPYHGDSAIDASSTEAAVAPVFFIGDSITMGAWVSTPDRMFVSQVRDYLQSRGVDATDDAAWTLDPLDDLRSVEKAAASRRNLIIVEVGVHWSTFNAAQFRDLYGTLLDCLAGSGARVVVGTIPWLNWPPDTPLYLQMASYSQIIREEAERRGVVVADLWAATNGRADAISRPGQKCFSSPACEGDNFHPGDTGHALIALAYDAALDAALASAPPHSIAGCNLSPYIEALASGRTIPIQSP